MKPVKAAVLSTMLSISCMANTHANARDMRPPTPACVVHAAVSHHLPLTVILALMRTEGGHPGTVHPNYDKHGRVFSYDLGVMQINNTTWLPEIAQRDFGGNQKLAWETIRDNGCYNVMWGAEIFSRYVDEAQGRYWLAVGYYNSHTLGPRITYTRQVARRFMEVMSDLKKYGVIASNKSG